MTAGTRHSMVRCPSRGFTLVELLITLVILVVLMTIAVPSFTDIIRNNRVTSHANELISLLIMARTEAVKQRGQIFVVIDSGAGWRGRVCTDALCSNTLREANYQQTSVSAVLQGDPDETSLEISFGAMGRAQPSGLNLVRLQHAGCSSSQTRVRARVVSLSAAGQPQLNPEDCI